MSGLQKAKQVKNSDIAKAMERYYCEKRAVAAALGISEWSITKRIRSDENLKKYDKVAHRSRNKPV